MDRESRLDVRANAHGKQCFHYQRLIRILKPEWFALPKDDELFAFADMEECPLNAISEIFQHADESWNHEGDYHQAIEEASKKCSKALDDF